jgi:putative thioredoxin
MDLIKMSKQKPVVSVFTADWLGSAFLLDTFIEELAAEYAEDFSFLRIEVDDDSNEVEELSIEELPTTFIMKDGEVVEFFVGLIPKRKIRQKLDKVRA